MIDTSNLNNLTGAAVHGDDDKKIGTVGQVYVDSDTQAPSWVTIKTGLFGNSETFAPLSDATYTDGVVRLPYDKDFVKDAPRIDDDGSLSPTDEDALYSYYGNGTTGSTDRTTGTSDVGEFDRDADLTAGTAGRTATDRPTDGHDTSGPNTDDAMTRSEERLNVGTERVETGRARLRKHVVTENVSETVPVSHEEVTLDREPITDANVGDATSGPSISEEEHEVVLTGDRVVTDKETVPVERVSLGTETVNEQQRVDGDVQKEEIDLVDPDTDKRAN